MTANINTNTVQYIASVWTPSGEAIAEKVIEANNSLEALGAANIWADNDYCEPYQMNCTIVVADANTGTVMGWWLGEGSTPPAILIPGSN
jgi:hypothetical protein